MPRELKLSKVVGRNSSNISRSAWSLAARASSIAVPVPRESFRPFISRFKLRSCIQLLFEARQFDDVDRPPQTHRYSQSVKPSGVPPAVSCPVRGVERQAKRFA